MKSKKKADDFRLFVKSRMCLKSITREEMAIYMRMSVSTFCKKMHDPSRLTMADVKVLSEKLNIDKCVVLDMAG